MRTATPASSRAANLKNKDNESMLPASADVVMIGAGNAAFCAALAAAESGVKVAGTTAGRRAAQLPRSKPENEIGRFVKR